MKLNGLSYPIDHAGNLFMVIEDDALLCWADENGLSAREAQAQALDEGIVPLRYLKNFSALNLAEQHRICRSKVFICGCGGLGGTLINLLARAGVGCLRVADCDDFSPSNLNRQWLSDSSKLSQPKVEAAVDAVASINPFVEVEAHRVLINNENVESFIRGADLVLDALDNIQGRFTLLETARDLGVPFVHAAVAGWLGQVSTFLPNTKIVLSRIYGSRRTKDSEEEALGVLGPVAATIASFQALEALRLLAGKRPAYENQLLHFNGETGKIKILSL
jgi:molybdopterin/thiamine biosynthesis adenylyltransferase